MKRKAAILYSRYLQPDMAASVTVFFVALPLCLGIALASGAPVYSGLIAGVIGGIVVSLLSNSQLSVSGPAAGLTAICAAAIVQIGSLELFFAAVAMAGILQVLLGVFRLGGITSFIPSAVIRGMLAAIGILLISKQIPLLIGYNQPDFWRKEFFNILTFNHGFEHITNLYEQMSVGVVVISFVTLALLLFWENTVAKKFPMLPSSFIAVVEGALLAALFAAFVPALQISEAQYIHVPQNLFASIPHPNLHAIFSSVLVWQNALLICIVASIETLLSIEAIDRLDPLNRISPKSRELMAQGIGNFASGMVGGLPITAVIVRSSANAEAGARTKLSSILHGVWLLLAILFAVSVINMVPYCVLAIILLRTGYNLAKPKMIALVYRQGREQFLPFAVTVIAILLTDLLIGVMIGIGFAIYFLVQNTYRAGFTLREYTLERTNHYIIELALNVSFLNKKRIADMLDQLPENASVEIIGTRSIYIDHDILEIFQDFKSKARDKNIRLLLKDIPEVETIELH